MFRIAFELVSMGLVAFFWAFGMYFTFELYGRHAKKEKRKTRVGGSQRQKDIRYYERQRFARA